MNEKILSDDYLILEDWKMTKDRIKHFDEMVMKIRLQAFPISIAFLSIGWGLEDYPLLIWSPWIFLFASIYLIPVACLDLFHYVLLGKSVDHAREIEKMDTFKGKLQITTKLTSKRLSHFHKFATALVYGIIFCAGIFSFLITIGVLNF